MKIKRNPITAIKVVMYWLMHCDYGLLEKCSYCGSLKIVAVESKTDGKLYKAKYKCMDCGAVAEVAEVWEKGE